MLVGYKYLSWGPRMCVYFVFHFNLITLHCCVVLSDIHMICHLTFCVLNTESRNPAW